MSTSDVKPVFMVALLVDVATVDRHIVPWNYPILEMCKMIAPCIAAGCTSVRRLSCTCCNHARLQLGPPLHCSISICEKRLRISTRVDNCTMLL